MLTKQNQILQKKILAATCAFVLFLSAFSGIADAKERLSKNRPELCTEIRSPLNRLSCFDEYFKTPIHFPEKTQVATIRKKRQPEILKTAKRMEKKQRTEATGLLHESMIEHESIGQKRVILTSPALGSQPPRPLLIISCINNITRFQLGLNSPINSNSVKVSLSLNGRSVDEDYHWRVIGSGHMIDAGHGIPSIRVLKKIVGHDRLLVSSSETSLQRLIFDISDFSQYIKEFRTACHW